MTEIDGPVDKAIQLAAREAALEHIREGLNVPVWENERVVWKPAAQALAEADAQNLAEELAEKAKRRARKPTRTLKLCRKPTARRLTAT